MSKKIKFLLTTILLVLILFIFGGCKNKEKQQNIDNHLNTGETAVDANKPLSVSNDNAIRSQFDLAGKPIAVLTGTMFDIVASQYLPNSEQSYYNSTSDMVTALETGKVAAYLTDAPIARLATRQFENHKVLATLTTERYAFCFPKAKQGSVALCEQMSDFIIKCKEDGTLADIDNIWFGEDESLMVVNLDSLTGENGKLTMSICTVVGPPFVYVKDNKYVGYDIDLAYRFCKEYGYDLTIVNYNASGLFASLGSGKCDMAASCLAITDERKESIYFSEPYYEGGVVAVIKDNKDANESVPLIEKILDRFSKTFVKEDRWKLFLRGLETTFLIVVASAAIGAVAGFIFYLIYWRGNKFYCRSFDAIRETIARLPSIVILMIIYYIIFGSSNVNGIIVSIIGFSLLFAGNVFDLLKGGVNAISGTQREAAIALGYSERQALIKFILPQAAKYFLPGVNGALIALIKETAIVGYIAVSDLTQVSDIIRSHTFDAFFPLLSAAFIYFMMAWLLTRLVKKVEFNISLENRKIAILKGVKVHD